MQAYVVFVIAMEIAMRMSANDLSNDNKRLVLHTDVDTAAELIHLKQLVHGLMNRPQAGGGSTYIRWGRTTCDGTNATLVYAGYMGGSDYHGVSSSAGGNYLCLSSSPQWDYSTTTEDNKVLITGVEYRFNPHHDSDLATFLGQNLNGIQAPCAVCLLPSATSLMIPGRTDCYPGWNKEYSGYIVTGLPGEAHATEYVCLDRRPEAIVGTGNREAINMMYFVEAHCQSGLECPPYENGRELACVVCSIAIY
ncbi:uncharacterized protein LOC127834821 [Dreissena polymorpha]|uniref:uncharacterized protein LOC127834821 n=1 Tax=Dreissena polymorpha TaxID=45954 RepID=UPI00226472F5|nr:uncharacterized protein LOC127834821 [Dreissena polymorpha]